MCEADGPAVGEKPSGDGMFELGGPLVREMPSNDCEDRRIGPVVMGWCLVVAGVTHRMTGEMPSIRHVHPLLSAPARPETLA